MALYRRGKVWWFSFTYHGRRVQQSTDLENKKEAGKIAKIAFTRLVEGRWGLAEQRPSISVGELLNKLEADYRLGGKLSPQKVSAIKRVREDFGTMKSDAVTAEFVDRYIEKRKTAGAANATINRVTELLRRAYNLAKLPTPEIRHLSERDNARSGFFTPAEFNRIELFLPEYLKDFSRFAFLTGWRRNEIRSLTWNDVEDNAIYLRRENAKNGAARSVPISGELVALIERRKAAKSVKREEGILLASTVFHCDGEPIGEFRKAWATASVAAGLGTFICLKCDQAIGGRRCTRCEAKAVKYVGRIFHDLRRSAVKNLIDCGVNQKTAMEISGHKTDAMFRRYHIVSQEDKAAAMKKIEQHNRKQQEHVIAMAAGR
jgi:integrase